MSGLEFIPFEQRLPTLRYQHAVVVCGQKLLYLILKTLICGNIHKIDDCVKAKLKTNTQYKSSFTRDEQQHLEKGDAKKWDVSLLFKLIQKVCGLEPVGNTCWIENTDDNESLEYLITTLKELRNELVHNLELIINVDQLEKKMDELSNMALNMITALRVRAQELGKQFSQENATETSKVIIRIIEDAKGQIKAPTVTSPGIIAEAIDDEDDSDEEDEYDPNNYMFDSVPSSVYQAAGAGQVPQEPSFEEVFKDLRRKFWEYAGPKETEI